MVAIVSGNSLGLNLTSSGVLGTQGVYGDPTTGQGGEQVYVNAATGNLVMQQLQDQLVGSGLDVTSVLTYNSLGLANDDNGDNFSIGKAPVQLVLSGTVNTAGSTLTRTAFDGSQAVYTWDAANSRYVSTSGAGAFDTITYAASRYTWIDGGTQQKETYDGTTGRLLTRADAVGNTITLGYDAGTGMLTTVTDANGETVTYVYSGTLLTQIKAPVTTWVGGVATTSVQPVVTYGYDASNRLTSVTVDLTPDGSTTDGKVYTTSYTYDGTSKRVQTVSQSDGTKLTFAYDASNRVYTITDALLNVTTFTYDTTNRKTSVLANGQTTSYGYNAAGQLLSVTAPTVNGVSPITQFSYTAEGELASTTDADGRTVSIGYDAAGNQVSVLDGAGNLTTSVFDAQNRLVSETTMRALTPALVAVGMTVSGGNVTKTGTSTGWDASVRSVSSIAGSSTVAFTATSSATNVMVGLNSDPDTDASFASIDYAFHLSGGSLGIYVSGGWKGTFGTYVAGDRFSVSYDGGGHVNFLKNDQVLYSLAATPTQSLFVDSSFYEPGSGVANLTFAARSAGVQTMVASAGTSVDGGDALKISGSTGWDAGARSIAGIYGSAAVSFTATSSATNVMVGLNSDPDTDESYPSIDYTFHLSGGSLGIYASGSWIGTFGTYAAGDRFSVSYDGAGHVNFLKNGQVLYSLAATPAQPLYVDTSFYEPGSGVSNLLFGAGATGDQTLINTAGMSIGGGNAVKSAGTTAWDAAVRSASGISGPATVSFTATSAATDLMVGLNTDPDTDTSYSSIDYALYLDSGTLRVFSNGTTVSNLVGSYVAGDRLSVSYDGNGNVNFLKNGQLLYTMSATVTQPLYVDSSFYDVGSSVTNLTFTAIGAADPATRYVYSADGKGLLRFKISAEGRVTEYSYNAQGVLTSTLDYPAAVYSTTGLGTGIAPSEATMTAWRGTQDLTRIERTDFVRDSRQQISSTITYGSTTSAGVGVGSTAVTTTFVYDPSGRLMQVVKPGAATTTCVYDGLGRMTSTTDSLGRTTAKAYSDAAGTIAVTYANQLVTTTALDKDGRVVSTTSAYAATAMGKNSIDYDGAGNVLRMTDLTGVSTWYLYDSLNRKVAAIDGTGALTEYVYDNAGLVTETIAYASRVNVALLVDGNGKPNNPSLASVRPTFNAATDQRHWVVYDAAGRAVQTIGSTGVVTQVTFDAAGRTIASCTFATTINVSGLGSAPSFQFVASSSADRIAHSFYDGDGNLVGSLDPDNFLTVYQYDAAGQRTVTIRYATQSPAATIQSTLAQLIPSTSPADQRSVTLYSGEGLVSGQIDPLGYLTQYFYNPRHTIDHTTRYATSVGNAIAAGSLVDSIKPTANAADATTSYIYDADDRVSSQTDPAGIITTFAYDSATDELLSTTAGSGRPDATTTQKRYDAMGRVVQQLDAVGSALTVGQTQAQIDAIWAQRAVTYTYDLAGRQASVKDALGNTTLYFYDGDGQLRYTVDPLNNVKELRYDAFGHVSMMIAYATAINPSGIGSGGLVTTGLTSAVAAAANSANDSVSRSVYDTAGHLTLTVDPSGAATSYAYDANGNVTQERQYVTPLPSGGAMNITYSPSGSAVARELGTFKAGDTITATIEFKGVAGTQAGMFLGNSLGTNAYDSVASSNVTCDGTWQTLTLTLTLTQDRDLQVYLYSDTWNSTHVAGAAVQYDNLALTSLKNGVVLTDSFDNVAAESAAWGSPGNWVSQSVNSLADVGTGAQLQALATAVADPMRDRVTRKVYDADGRVTLSVDAAGAATGYTYDANGNMTQERQYATPLPSAGAMNITYSSSGSAVARELGTFKAGDTITATIEFKGVAGTQAGMFLGNSLGTNAYDSVASSNVTCNGAWQTLTLTLTLTQDRDLQVYLYSDTWNSTHVAGAAVQYDNLALTSLKNGVVLTDSFDNVAAESAAWGSPGNWVSQTVNSLADVGTNAQLQAFALTLADNVRDRITSYEYDADGHAVWSSDALGQATRTIYDVMGRPIYLIAPDGAVTRNDYDADGRIIRTTTFATKLTAANFASLPHAVTATQLQAMLVASPAHDAVLARQYDDLGRVRFMMDGTGGVSEMRYDVDGNVVDSIAYATRIDPTTWSTTTPPAVTSDAVHDRHIHASFDAFGNLIAQSDGTGAVVVNTYDADGRLTDRVSYAKRIVAGSWTSGQLPTLTTDALRDIHERFAYDSLGRLSYSADGTGAVTAYAYDADGRLAQKTLLATAATPGQVLSSVATNALLDRSERFSYDAFGRQTWHSDANGSLDYTAYDADGRVTQTIRIAQPQTGALPAVPPTPVAADRVTSYAYNAFGQVTYAVDPLNRVSLTTYDRVGRTSAVTRFSATAAAGVAVSSLTMAGNSSVDEITQFQYDAAGNLLQRTDAMGGVQGYSYDGLGNRLTLTDEKNQVWTYTYDAASRQLTQTTPLVSITGNSVSGTDLVDSTGDAAIVTSMAYDGLGNLTQRIEAYGRPSARTTIYTYDADGRQAQVQGQSFTANNNQDNLPSSVSPVSTTFYDAFGNVVATIDPAGAITYATYDMANRATYSVDQLGYVTGEVRNVFGDVLTQTKYGAQTTLIGAAPTSAADAPTTSSVGSAVSALAHGSDRVTTFTYDNVGRVKSQAGMSGYFVDATAGSAANAAESAATPTTTYQYDAFGDVVLQQQLVNQAQGLYASTYHYFDVAGQETDTVDASGYQTHRTFDSFGNITQTLEYATAKTGSWSVASLGTTPTTSANDRTTSDVFDRLDRRTSEMRTVDYSLTDDGTISGHSLTTSWGYDAQGHVTRVTDPTGANTYRSYDALGRLRSVVAPARSSTVDGSTITPVVEYGYDPFGNISLVAQRFNTATNVVEFTGAWTSSGAKGYTVATSSSDRITRTRYDNAGHAIQVDDPMAATTQFHNTWNDYDIAGRLVYTKHQLNTTDADTAGYKVYHGYQYDAAGQMTASNYSVGTAAAAKEASSQMRYNAFGEVVAKGIDSGWQEFFNYDNNGNLWLTNTGTGVVTAYAYDLQGHVTQQYTSQGIDLSTATSIQGVAAQSASLRVVNTVHDLVGNARRVDQATRSTSDAGVSVRVGATAWTVTQSGTTNSLSLTFNSLASLGNGQVQFDIKYKSTNNTACEAIVVADSAQAASAFVATWTPAVSTPGIQSITSVVTSKKDTNGDWRVVNSSTASGVSHTQIEIDAPDNPRSIVTFTYTKSGGSPVTLSSPATAGGAFTGLIGYGNEYSFDTSTLAAGSYTYSTTITTADGAVSTPRTGSFTVGTNLSPSTVTTQITPSVFQTFDRWGNVLSVSDARSASWITTYQYNGSNQLVVETQPAPLTGGSALVTKYFYDRQGHRVATTDANSYVHGQLFDAAGQLVETDEHPVPLTLVKTTDAYDVFGELVQSVAGDGYTTSGAAVTNIADYTTRNTYDAVGDLLSVQHGIGAGNVSDWNAGSQASVNERQAYTYDADGHRLSSWDDAAATHLITTYAYDAVGHLISTTLPLVTGQSVASKSSYVYDDEGHETSETDANGNTETWAVDYYGRTTAHKDLGTTTYSYSYDNAGQLVHQASSGGQNLNYSFNAAGQETSVYDGALNETTTYTYDAAGNHLQESTSVAGKYYQDNHLAYDNIGRLVDSSDDEIHVSFQYDAVGNRTFVGTHVLYTSTLIDVGSATPQTDTTSYFSYDGMNRQLHADWQSQTLQGQQGHTVTYDADGNRLSDVFMNNLVTVTGTATTNGTGPDGAPIYTFFTNQSYAATNALVTQLYTYDADDRLVKTLNTLKSGTTTGWIQIDARSYDTAGRLMTKGANLPGSSTSSSGTTLLSWLNSVNPSTGLVGMHLDSDKAMQFSYNEAGQLTLMKAASAYSTAYTYDAAGNEVTNTLNTNFRDSAGLSHRSTVANTNTIKAAEGYETTAVQSNQSTAVDRVDGGTDTTSGSASSSTTYDVNGRVSADSNSTVAGTFNLVSDAQGNVLRKTFAYSTGTSELRNLVINGESIGQYGADASIVTQEDGQRFTFTFGFQSMEDSNVQTGTSTLTASEGETLQQAAMAAYGDASLWQRLAAVNGLGARDTLKRGQRLVIAGSGGEMFNSGSTFAVNDPGSMIGATGPRTVVSDAPMTSREKDEYYKDVFNRPAPNFSNNAEWNPNNLMSVNADKASDRSGAAAIATEGGDPNWDTSASSSATPTAAQANAIKSDIAAGGYTADDFVAAGATVSQMRTLNDIGAFGNAGDGAYANSSPQGVGPYSVYDYQNGSNIADSNAIDPATAAQDVREQSRFAEGARLNAGSVHTVRSGDNLSSIMGTSDPQALGNLMRANGMRNSNLAVGQNVFIPADSTLYGNQAALGQSTLNSDNARLQAIADARAAAFTQVATSPGSGDVSFMGTSGSFSDGTIDTRGRQIISGAEHSNEIPPQQTELDMVMQLAKLPSIALKPVNDWLDGFQGRGAGGLTARQTFDLSLFFLTEGLGSASQVTGLSEGSADLGGVDVAAGVQTVGNTTTAGLSAEDALVLQGDASRAQIVQTIGEAAQPSVKALLALDPEAQVGFRGSLANGLKNDTKLGPNGERVAFDGFVETKNGLPYTGPQGYDADFFVVSDNLAAQLGNKPFFRNAARLDTSLNGIFEDFGTTLQSDPLLSGMKPEPPTFRVFTSTEIQKKLNAGDAQIYFIPGQP